MHNEYHDIFLQRMSQDDIPHWEYQGKKYSSKTQCFEVAGSAWRNVQFNLYNSVFSTYDWAARPQTTIQELYDRRITQLRERYDYLRVLFSGGTDSVAIVQAAQRNKVYIDELVIVYAKDGDYVNRAETDRAVKIVEQFGDFLKHTKFTHIAYDKEDIVNYWKYQNQLSGHLYYPSTPQSLEYHYLHSIKPEITETLWAPVEQGLTHCDIFGKEPSSIINYNNEPCWFLTDNKVVYHTTAWSEWFYTTPSLPEFQSLQNHLSVDIMHKHNVEVCDPLFFDEVGWKELCETTNRFYHPDAKNDKLRSGTRKDLMRVYNYVKDDAEFKNQFMEYCQENIRNPLYMVNWPKVAMWELKSPAYGLHSGQTYDIADVAWFKNRSKTPTIKQEQNIIEYFKALWADLNISNRKEPQ